MAYVTEKRFRRMGLGANLTDLTSIEIREQLNMGGVAVDSYCNVPVYPQRYSFKGGTISGEQQSWHDHYRRRVYLLHHPIVSVESIRIDATNNLYIDFEPDDYYVNRSEGYVELINFALTKVGIWGQADVPALGLSQPVAVVDYTYGYRFPVVDEELMAVEATTSGEEDWSEYMGQFGNWSEAIGATIKKNGVVVNEDDFEVDWDGGFVTFDTALTKNDVVTASYTYTVPWEVARANAIATAEFLGQAALTRKGMTGLESLEIEELRIRRIGSRSGAERGIDLPVAAQMLLDGYRFMTIR